eukprot:1174470-Prorocentrum_minimum.AAC.1
MWTYGIWQAPLYTVPVDSRSTLLGFQETRPRAPEPKHLPAICSSDTLWAPIPTRRLFGAPQGETKIWLDASNLVGEVDLEGELTAAKAAAAEKEAQREARGRGRPKGSTNRPKDAKENMVSAPGSTLPRFRLDTGPKFDPNAKVGRRPPWDPLRTPIRAAD